MAANWTPSEFLRFQDKNNDGLPDVCTPLKPIEIPKCPACLPKPSALVPRWRNRSRHEPFLNERRCLYQITYTTAYVDTGAVQKYGAAVTDEQAKTVLEERANRFKEDASDQLLKLLRLWNSPIGICRRAQCLT